VTVVHAKYRGRFAPSPSGPLHFGSLVCAVASFVDAKANLGDWLIRIEDIDSVRTVAGSQDRILETLALHGMQSDAPILIQSQRLDLYRDRCETLMQRNKIYACDCTRKQIKRRGEHYDSYCRQRNLVPTPNHALRIINQSLQTEFVDLHLGNIATPQKMCREDFVLRRRDGFYAYNFVVVVDDIEQGISRIVRGADLLETTLLQQYLFSVFAAPVPEFCHIPVAASKPGFKLSKQNHATAINNKTVLENLKNVLIFLGFDKTNVMDFASSQPLLQWAASCWSLNLMPKQTEVLISS